MGNLGRPLGGGGGGGEVLLVPATRPGNRVGRGGDREWRMSGKVRPLGPVLNLRFGTGLSLGSKIPHHVSESKRN